MVFNIGELLTVGLVFSALSLAAAVGLILAQHLDARESARLRVLTVFGVNISAALATWLLTSQDWEMVLPLALTLTATITARWLLKNFTVAGRFLLMTGAQFMLFGTVWGLWFIATMPVSTLTRTLMFAGCPLLILTLPSMLVQTVEQWEVLCRRRWLRPRTALPLESRSYYPKVSLHVPAYSEPPDVVIATLDALARLKYPNFEVLVIDNNTKNPDLWRPVQAHCRHLGEHFRFFHLDSLPGAKAGALNFALQNTDRDAELIGVIDSDYQVEPDFLARLVGYFDDPAMGFVQPPHDYRGWEDSLYLKMCYWEYRWFFETSLVSQNERNSAITVGTMCLIRRTALEQVGGWAEWCATEDSELAIRIHAAGYSSVNLTTTFGRGLIPETFEGFQRQRFRWTCGPVQELKHHLHLYLPWRLRRPSALSHFQRIHHLNHGLENLNPGLALLLTPLGVAVSASMMLHGEVVQVPLVLALATFVILASGFAHRWLVYRVIMGCSLKDALGAFVAGSALNHTRGMASLCSLFNRSIPWHRTNKFKALPSGLAALNSARTESLLGLALLAFGVAALTKFPQPGLHLLFIIAVFFQSISYLTAPALALLAEWDIRCRGVSSSNFVRDIADGIPYAQEAAETGSLELIKN
jgi:hypothetical protein